MRLKQIKLAGFKSFVDPTTVSLPSNLTAIVGPNGCGKSNLIDAVRWVMGESSAKNLRGDAMTDVIFNGSTGRKPVGQASIELVFDNSDGTVQGEFANYNEISVKRMVNREAQSSYFLNGTRCRRKDITDIFLGTGLGPRSYAIIEQGMISRLIESKPHELRIFLEEAAGISKYKERRKETENRIRHTRDNLDRLTDLREELGKQLSHLKRQATSAERYKEYKAEERELKAQLAAIRWQTFNSKIEALDDAIQKMETEVEAKIADQRHADSEIEKSRELHIELTDAHSEVQGRFYGIGADIARLEQAIEHARQQKSQLLEDKAQVQSSLDKLREQLRFDESKLEELMTELLQSEPDLELKTEQVEEQQQQLQDMEEDMRLWQQDWDVFNQQAHANAQKTEVEKTRIQHLESHIARYTKRLEDIRAEINQQESSPMENDLVEIAKELSLAEEQSERLEEEVSNAVEQINQIRQQQREHNQKLEVSRKELRGLESRKISLEALQSAALGGQSEESVDWLKQQGLDSKSRLAQNISVDSGWELAAETVLGENLEAVVVKDSHEFANSLAGLASGKLILVSDGSSAGNFPNTLHSKIKGADALAGQLSKVKVADSLEQAISIRAQLADDESVITQDGLWLGKNWLRVSKQSEQGAGILEREAELNELAVKIEQQEAVLEEFEQTKERLSEQLSEQEQLWQSKQSQLAQASRTYSELRAKVGSQQAKLEQAKNRLERLQKEQRDVMQQLQDDEELLAKSRQQIELMVDSMADDNERREKMTAEREEKRAQLEAKRQQARQVKDEQHQLAIRVSAVKAEVNSTRAGFERVNSQIGELTSRKVELENRLSSEQDPTEDYQIELEQALEKRLLVEEELKQARNKLSEIDDKMRKLERQRHESEQQAQGVRSRLEKLRMDWQEAKTRQNTQSEILADARANVETILEELPEEANEQQWLNQIEEITGKIQRLGAINLAAIEEYKAAEERKTYLDAQHEDLIEALETLESAIRKIDHETRTRFKETFDKVNKGVQELFPKVFGGGHAYLELTGENLLDTGVAVMARPPGKRNSTIHLLSGGEKALTAISLVFSIFRLNPAPFCMLDEVDAPLDDANVGRYANLVKEMSDQVQFIAITHNKIAMEMAHNLLGVTMSEPGVSRVVSVDVDEAAALAAS
ncbi:chromosome segregation protein SMC [Kangiella profundi]|uniref:Chromosome partition protein Smc n=1 Tax=Kangiella profundi TaxID=1561924 RepID=A0A2K9A7Q6_9GAMM|nr:chromosome segregation protein SMC [Kangiella profundi]AUD78750.1 chromosome segregation protein SMC [Kangiella profundi]GGF04519.1 chromosome partition protein Smc [Kangiella profundi]